MIMACGTLLMGASIRLGLGPVHSDPGVDPREAMVRLTTAACNDEVGAVRDVIARLPSEGGARREASIRALHIATTLGHVRLVRAMLDDGAPVDAKSLSGCTALMMSAGEPNSVQIATLLLDAGADVNAIDSRGATPLMCAAMADDAPLAELLLEHSVGAGENPSITAARCATPSDPRPSSRPGRPGGSSFPR
jgi:ankyrin repeat protein